MKASVKVQTILEKALSFESSAEGAAFIQEACAGNDKLRAEIEAVLASADDAAAANAKPAGAELDAETAIIVNSVSAKSGLNLLAEVPRTFGGFELHREVGRGVSGVIHKARQVSSKRIVALKVLHFNPKPDGPEMQRLRAEAAIVAKLDHPNIVPLREFGEHKGVHFYTMEFMDGGSLAASMKELMREPKLIARSLAGVANAVHFAHQRNILHLGLKPANILFDTVGVAHVSVFGRSWQIEKYGQRRLSEMAFSTGALHYMSPEQVAEQPVSSASDIYSIGMILYEMLAGQNPFKGDTMSSVIARIRKEEPIRPQLVNPAANGGLETICLKCLAKNPAERYATAEELAMDLKRFLRGEPILARPVNSMTRVLNWAMRLPIVL